LYFIKCICCWCINYCEISDYHSGLAEDLGRLGSGAVTWNEWFRRFEGAYCLRNVGSHPLSYIVSLSRNPHLYSTIEPHIRCHYSGRFGRHMNIKKQGNNIWRCTGERACLFWSALIRLVKMFRAVKVIRIFISLFEKAHHRIIPVYIFTTLSNEFCIVQTSWKIIIAIQSV